MDIQLSSLPERINLYLNSANRTMGDSASSFEMVMANTLITADTNEIFFINVKRLLHSLLFLCFFFCYTYHTYIYLCPLFFSIYYTANRL